MSNFLKSHIFFLHCRQTNIHIKHLESHLKHIAQDKSASLFLVLRNGESTTWLKKFKKEKENISLYVYKDIYFCTPLSTIQSMLRRLWKLLQIHSL